VITHIFIGIGLKLLKEIHIYIYIYIYKNSVGGRPKLESGGRMVSAVCHPLNFYDNFFFKFRRK